MGKGIIHHFGKVVELENPAQADEQNVSDEQPTVADLVLPGTGYKFSDSFVCPLGELGRERDLA